MYRIRPLPSTAPETPGISLEAISDAVRRAESLVRAAWKCQQANRPEEAIKAYLEAAKEIEPSDPRRQWRVLVPIKNNLASLYGSAGRVEEAEACYIQAINLLESCDVSGGATSLASLYSNLAVLYARTGLGEAALKMQAKCIDLLNREPKLHVRERFQALRTMEGFCERVGRKDLIPDLLKQRDQLAAMVVGLA